MFVVCRKNVPDYSASRELNDLGFVTFDLNAGNIENISELLFVICNEFY